MLMNFIIDNWFVFVGLIAIITMVVIACIKFFELPTSTQIKKIKEWLLWAVCMAEKELGSGTGTLKLRYVWDLFIQKFPMASKFITFDMFSSLVDEAIEEMKKLLEQNDKIEKFIIGE